MKKGAAPKEENSHGGHGVHGVILAKHGLKLARTSGSVTSVRASLPSASCAGQLLPNEKPLVFWIQIDIADLESIQLLPETDIVRDAAIQRFEFTFELV